MVGFLTLRIKRRSYDRNYVVLSVISECIFLFLRSKRRNYTLYGQYAVITRNCDAISSLRVITMKSLKKSGHGMDNQIDLYKDWQKFALSP